jgi:hypothetical protein
MITTLKILYKKNTMICTSICFLSISLAAANFPTTHLLNGVFNFFEIFCLEPKWWLSIGTCRKSGYHPYEDLAKYGVQIFNHLFINFDYILQPNVKIWHFFTKFFPHFW